MYCTIPDIVSLILVPILIVLLVFVLLLLILHRKTDTLAQLAYELKKLMENCEKEKPDLKELKKLDISAAKCALLCERATFEQKLDVGSVPNKIDRAHKILRSLHSAKTPSGECGEYLKLARKELNSAYRFLINTLGITAAPASASLKFFKKNIRSENARKYLDSLNVKKPEQETTDNITKTEQSESDDITIE